MCAIWIIKFPDLILLIVPESSHSLTLHNLQPWSWVIIVLLQNSHKVRLAVSGTYIYMLHNFIKAINLSLHNTRDSFKKWLFCTFSVLLKPSSCFSHLDPDSQRMVLPSTWLIFVLLVSFQHKLLSGDYVPLEVLLMLLKTFQPST